jgi:hypothetical protein
MKPPLTTFVELVQVSTATSKNRRLVLPDFGNVEISPAVARKLAKDLTVSADWAEQ